MHNLIADERSILRICRNLTVMLVFITISCCVRQYKPDASVVNKNWQVTRRDPFPSQIFAVDLIPEYTDKDGNERKWAIIEDVAPTRFQVKDLEMVSFLEDCEKYITSGTALMRAVKLKANLGLVDARYVLEHQAEIPVEFRNKVLVFPGTLLDDSFGTFYVSCLYGEGDSWFLDFLRVYDHYSDWPDKLRLVRSK